MNHLLHVFNTMIDNTSKSGTAAGGKPGFVERRSGKDRRRNSERRTHAERRHDFRDGDPPLRIGLRGWLRSKVYTRLGVDRRKNERRCGLDRRRPRPQSLLSREELSDLLSR